MITLEALQDVLNGFQGATFASLDTITEPTLSGGKANPFKGKLEKVAVGHRVMLFTNTNSNGYANKVARHLEQAGLNPASFQLGPLPWGERLPNSPIIKNTCKKTGALKHYLQVVFLKSAEDISYRALETIHVNEQVSWPVGHIIPKELIQGLSDKTGSEHQGLERDKQVIVRSFCLDNIVALRCFNEELK